MNKWLTPGLPQKITTLVDGESDRGAILILTAYLEELLGEVLRAACASVTSANKLLELRGVAGDFDSKIQLCSAFALIHEDEERALHALRKIRNSAAHFDQKGRGFDVLFDSPRTVDLVTNLAAALNTKLVSREPESVKRLFIALARLLATKLMIRAIMARPPTPTPSIKEMADEFRTQMEGTELGNWMKEMEDTILNGDAETAGKAFKTMTDTLRSAVQHVIGKPEVPNNEDTPEQ